MTCFSRWAHLPARYSDKEAREILIMNINDWNLHLFVHRQDATEDMHLRLWILGYLLISCNYEPKLSKERLSG